MTRHQSTEYFVKLLNLLIHQDYARHGFKRARWNSICAGWRQNLRSARYVVSARISATWATNRDLTGLIKLDVLEQTGKGRSTRYVFKKK